MSYTLCYLLEQYCRQMKETFHRQYAVYQNSIVEKIKETYHRYCVNYQNSIVDKSNRYIIDIVLTIRTVLQTNQTDISQILCQFSERYGRQKKHTYHRHCANYQKGIVYKSNRPMIDNMLYIRTVFQINQTYLSYALC